MQVITITMLRDERGSPDGIVLRDYTGGQTYDLPESLAHAFVVDMACAEYGDRSAALVFEPDLEPAKPKAKAAVPKRKSP